MGQTNSQTSGLPTQNDGAFMSDFGNGPPRSTTKAGRFKHPMAALFHVLFKSLALLLYIFGGLFGQDFMTTFVLVVLLISMDFWVVKNVTGRLLAGLRWSNYIDDEGDSHWVFENRNAAKGLQGSQEGLASLQDELTDNSKDNGADVSIFWTGLIMAPTIWLLLMFVAIFKFNVQWFMLVILALTLSSSNLYGYFRCRLGTSEIKSSVTQFVAKQLFLNYLTGSGSSTKPMP